LKFVVAIMPPVAIIPPVFEPPRLDAPAMFDMPPVDMAPPVSAAAMPPAALSEGPGLLLEQATMDRDPNKPNVLNELNRMISLSIVEKTDATALRQHSEHKCPESKRNECVLSRAR
jgi:hypothetical protein